MSIWLLVASIVVIAAGLTFALDRQMAREQERRRFREWAARSPEARRMAANFAAFQTAVGTALVPAFKRMAPALSSLNKVAE